MKPAVEHQQPTVVIVGLGPGPAELATTATLQAIESSPHHWLRTSRHPSASLVDGAETFDDVYDQADTIGSVYRQIVERLVSSAAQHGEVLYAVPGSPAVAEHTVELLVQDKRIHTRVIPALSFADLAWVRLGVDPLAAGARIVDGHRFAVQAAGQRGPLLVAQCDTQAVLSEVKLSVDTAPVAPVTVLHHLGLPDESVFEVPWDELDRSVEADHLTSLWIPELGAPVAGEVQRFVELVATLRSECPWDAEQTHASLRPHLLEETYEVLEALDAVDAATMGDSEALDDGYELLEEELGDLLFQVVFHSVLGAEAGRFTMADVARGIHDKLRSRHPHVFADVQVGDSDEVVSNWEAIKKAEKGRASAMDGIPPGLPALAYAQKVAKKAASAGLDVAATDHTEVGAATPPENEEHLGEWLFAVAAAARLSGLDAEQALRRATSTVEASVRAEEADPSETSGI